MFGLVESITNLIKPAAKPLKTQILYSSLSSTTKKLAEQLSTLLLTESEHLNSSIDTLDNLDLDSLINQTPIDTVNQLIIFLLPSYNVESPVDSVLSQFRDALYDFRLDKNSLAGLSFFVIGIGHSDYQNEFCKQAVELDSIIANLGARRIINLKKIDVSVDPEKDLSDYFQTVIRTTLSPSLSSFAQLPPLSSSSEDDDNDEDENSDDEFKDYTSSKPLTKAEKARQKSSTKKKKSSAGTTKEGTMDIEDLGTGIPQIEDLDIKDQDDEIIKKDMISPMTRKSLTKQGYAIVGSHSAVKTCRWTKASLRGRGFCYKHAFYGIQSHQCMEATPSLACANKCTFCWRAHTNPVGTSWRWKTDSAEYIIEESLKEHDRLIKQLSGMPGVRADRFTEARTPRHAALSLVGEPVMFPHIKKYISLLTEKRISTFLVTNAQFPESLKDLPPVTQLYLSIDAGTKESLKSIDRPLHRDFWERFLESIDIVHQKKNRTVFRLTIVKGENENQIKEYADLVRRGQPDFIEVKGVTYCGYPGSSNLTIKNSPWHEEVKKFVEDLCEEINDPRYRTESSSGESKDGSTLEYGLAAEHAHSCCVLAAHSKYYFDDKWHTWIDYDKFFELVEAGSTDFDGLDYCDITPDFALFNSAEAGFSPEDQRWFRKKTLAAQKEKLDQLNQDHQKEDDQNILPPPIGPSQ
ncbi:hypothetical protein MJO28_014050 [Puccinia striiformis f. sp. tritici]|uniref:tRNA 4-demethylwyosine synthase (AdoMet-dependent) n=3 Tax=Puccinia striiformis TaxID=27350 RepID=A0A0L0W0S8_9BASI|nr:hypothetical protein Pst134EA_025450 [Puccinia striiformis f. sp. tritici]KAI9613000.1 hypothetical protein H4Q26_010271 [Puccinia striiformis f. sp. tritici PST-130]KNF05133.1 hypothetical protein PSTG_01762 [Puccinia striiformis f. sp. tritici PST-78]POW06060.1 hypothetical protein PSTT_09269 [Puccinia striiformis]KAH9443688.1 hypothetical protein Pst134EB_026088 [Puccinia striiformis f. sp. tritici]KAH9451496.1 hypothetical protein Pst134EA_025450 [Puccinia striiformis f. sp. tritici]